MAFKKARAKYILKLLEEGLLDQIMEDWCKMDPRATAEFLRSYWKEIQEIGLYCMWLWPGLKKIRKLSLNGQLTRKIVTLS